jgi:hypothetical protein
MSNIDQWPPHIFELYIVLAKRNHLRQSALAMLRILPRLVDSLDPQVYKPYTSMATIGFLLTHLNRMIEIYANDTDQYQIRLYRVNPLRLIEQRVVIADDVLSTIDALTTL